VTCGECAHNRDRSGSAECKARGWGEGARMHPLHTHIVVQTNSRAQKIETRRACTRSAVSPPHAKAGGNHTVDKQAHTRTPGQVLVWQVVALQRNNNTHTHIHKHNRHGITTTQKEGKEARKVAGEDRFEEGGGTGGRTDGTQPWHALRARARGAVPGKAETLRAVRAQCRPHTLHTHAPQHVPCWSAHKGYTGVHTPEGGARAQRSRTPPHPANS
jgi:hypothetical protein